MNLVVTATGNLGGAVAKILHSADKPVRSLTRSASNRERLAADGIECVVGDLRDPASLRPALRGVRTVISMASGILSQDPTDLEQVDHVGQLRLIDEAENAGVEHFVFVSFPVTSVDYPLQRAKRAVEDRLRASKLEYTILQPTNFMEAWLSPMLGFDPANGKVRLFGSGERAINWISLPDVARFVAAAVDRPAARGKVLPLGGPDALSARQVVALFEELGGKPVELETVPEAALEAQLAGASNPIEASFAGLMLSVARGEPVESSAAIAALGERPQVSVRDYARRVLGIG